MGFTSVLWDLEWGKFYWIFLGKHIHATYTNCIISCYIEVILDEIFPSTYDFTCRWSRRCGWSQLLETISVLWTSCSFVSYKVFYTRKNADGSWSYFVSFYIGVICLGTLPALYEQYEREVNHLISKGMKDAKKMFNKFDVDVLNKIPRGRVKERKRK